MGEKNFRDNKQVKGNVIVQLSGFEPKKMTIFRQPNLLFEGDACASAEKRGEGSRKNGLFGPKCKPTGQLQR
jgi:hypothetical protein